MKRLLFIILSLGSILYLQGQNISTLQDYIVDRYIDATGRGVVKVKVPQKPPDNLRMPAAMMTTSSVTLPDVPAYDWSFGSSPTAAAMLAGYYDRIGYSNIYTGPSNGGIAPMDNSSWGFVMINGEMRKQCPISATMNGLDGRTGRGHVDDYWVNSGSSAQDPYITNGWIQHTYGDCTADYMKSNQSAYFNSDGSTMFYAYDDGTPYTDNGFYSDDGMYGLKLFFQSRGYTTIAAFNQLIYGYEGNILGFTFAQYKQQIDAGRPVIIQLEGHSMLGFGYDDNGNTIYLHDTWDYSTHQMTWGGTYHGMQHYMVSVIHLNCSPPSQPGTISGPALVCMNTINTYSVSPITGATSYTWTLPSGWSGSSTSTSINATAGSVGGTISVTANNPCGPGPAQSKSVSVIALTSLLSVSNINVLNGQNNCYNAGQTITIAGSSTTFTVQNGGSVTMMAGHSIDYLPGTRVYPGGYLHGYITVSPCCGFGGSSPSIATNGSVVDSNEAPSILQPGSAYFKVYPNPTSGNFVLELTGDFTSTTSIEIFGMWGEKILTATLTEERKREFSLSDQPTGIYFIRVISGPKTASLKIILTRQ